MADPLGRSVRFMAKYPGRILASMKITPDQLTLLGFLVNCAVAYFIAGGQLSNLTIGILIWVAGFFDALDGSVARITRCVTAFGNFFDSVLDRYSDSVIYLGILAQFLRSGRTGYVVLVAVAMIGSLAVSYTRAKAESLDLECEVGFMPRTVRIVILGAGFCVGWVFWGLLIIAVMTHLTVVQRIFYVRKNLLKAP
jgi:CDP-diacylglycerol---glycerol-3-phosphate 3-phosphatidyltransferase